MTKSCDMNGCDEPADNSKRAYGKTFCSTICQLKYEHLKADAKEAYRDAVRAGGYTQEQIDGPPY